MKYILSMLFITLSVTTIHLQSSAQGCVAVRSTGNINMLHPDENDKGAWQLSTTSRSLRSFRHFSGTTENKQRLVDGSEVINHQTSVDLALTRIVNSRWSFMMDVPILSNARSSLYEHGLVNGVYVKKERHTTHSFGLGDMRFAAYRWLLDPKKNSRGNIQAGLGIKLPTGDDNFKDYWYNVGPGGTKELRTVDQSIQLGDGGTGFTTELNAYYNFKRNFGMYGNFYYLINPREQNGVRTYRETLVASLANEAICSVPDQYMFRSGFNYSFNHIHGLTVAAGAKLECVPVHDLIGGSGDFRRPGYIWSIEPAVAYQVNKLNFFVSVPFAIARNRTQSVTDIENSIIQNKHVQGDAAFADYVINLGFSVKFK